MTGARTNGTSRFRLGTGDTVAYYDVIDTPVGPLFVGGSAEGIHRVDFLAGDGHGVHETVWSIAALERDAGEAAASEEGLLPDGGPASGSGGHDATS